MVDSLHTSEHTQYFSLFKSDPGRQQSDVIYVRCPRSIINLIFSSFITKSVFLCGESPLPVPPPCHDEESILTKTDGERHSHKLRKDKQEQETIID